MNHVWIENGISAKAVNDFFAKQKTLGNEIHCLEIYEKGNTVVRISQHPYSPDEKREVYSLSKTFTSTSIGVAIDNGLLDINERIIDIFPDKCPENISENLEKMTIKHLLSMNTGHATCVMSKMSPSSDCAKAFLEQQVKFEPGTHFVYNTGATCMLGAIIQKRTGMSLIDYAYKNILSPLGIEGTYWSTVKDGTNEAGTGIHISCDDILKLGIMYLNKGVYDGKRIVSEKWVDEASLPHSDNGGNGTPDWCSGYGYQMWINSRDGYRGDGAFGQLCMILPKYDAVVAVMANCMNSMQLEVDGVVELVENLHGDGGNIENLGFAAIEKCDVPNFPFLNKTFRLDSNDIGFEKVSVKYKNDALSLVFYDGKAEQVILAGNGEYCESSYNAKWRMPKILGLMRTDYVEQIKCASCFTAKEDGIDVFVRFLNSPNAETIKITCENNRLNIDFYNEADRTMLYENVRKLTGCLDCEKE